MVFRGKKSEFKTMLPHINSVIQKNDTENKLDLNDLYIPEKYGTKIENLILKNQDLFPNKNSELGKTNTVKCNSL